MAKLPLHQGFYNARSPIANAQLCINAYPEQNPPDAPFPVTVYPAPGLLLLSDYTAAIGDFPVRGIYQCSNGAIILSPPNEPPGSYRFFNAKRRA